LSIATEPFTVISTERSEWRNLFRHVQLSEFVSFFIKIEQIFVLKSPADGPLLVIFDIIRVNFVYADKSPELCRVNF